MKTRLSALLWIGVYLTLVALPLAVLLLGERPHGSGFWWDFSLALGYAGLAMMGVQFALTARFKRATAPFGIDIIYYFHRYLAVIAIVMLVAHAGFLLARHPDRIGPIDPRVAPGYMTMGWLGLSCFAAIIVSSLWRKRLRIEYDFWRRIHIMLALVGLALAVLHVAGSSNYLTSPYKRGLWTLLALSWMGLIAHVRLVRPWLIKRSPYRVVEVRKERGRSWTLALEPGNPPALEYHPGQFAWVTLRASPFSMREHPFSFSSSPTSPGRLEFTVKELGDFTSRIGEIQPGETAYVDGSYGAFGVDRWPNAPGFVFIAGGVGIAPVMSMLRALAERGDDRMLWLFYGNRLWNGIVFREELDALADRLHLHIVHVLTEPPPDWAGDRGFVTSDVLARHLPEDRYELHYFVCGPNAMIQLVEGGLRDLGVPFRHVHSEIFDLA